MSRRWGGRRAGLVAVDEAPRFMPPAPAPRAEVDAELAALREKTSRLQSLYNAEIRRADELERQLADAHARIAQKDRTNALLERMLAKAREDSPDVPWDGAETEPRAGTEAAHWYRIAHALQKRCEELQEANEGRDRHRATGWPR